MLRKFDSGVMVIQSKTHSDEELEGNYATEQEKLKNLLEVAEKKCSDAELMMKENEDELNLIIMELRKNLDMLQEMHVKEELDKLQYICILVFLCSICFYSLLLYQFGPTCRMTRMEARMEAVEKGNEAVWVELEQWRSRMEKIDRIDTLENKMDSMDNKMNTLASMMTALMKEKGVATESTPEMGSSSCLAENTATNEPSSKEPSAAVQQPQVQVVPEVVAAANHLSFPNFHGENPEAWISRAEQYFQLNSTPEARKVEVALVAMEGAALHWFQWTQSRFPNLPWSRLKHELLRRYGEDPMANTFEALMYTKQTGTVNDYVDLFISRLVHVPGLSDSYYLGMFLHGLRDEIRLQIRAKDAKDLFDTIHLAREIERELRAVRGYQNAMISANNKLSAVGGSSAMTRTTWLASGGRTSSLGISQTSPNQSVTPTNRYSTAARPTGSSSSVNQLKARHRQISHKEFLDKRAKGLCFRCDEPYSPLHKCADKTLQVLVALEPDDDELPEEHNNGDTPAQNEILKEDDSQLQTLELSSVTARGFDGPQTMKLKGKVLSSEVLVMVDSGASHCFISGPVAAHLGLEIDTSTRSAVRLGDGRRLDVSGVCRDLPLQLGYHFGSLLVSHSWRRER
ncbi:kinesin 3 [Perilla frutescens var. frutescens]|nr:kinesin 3 [Perilla frutescens var. frutescens]